jgi:hypothetical protein
VGKHLGRGQGLVSVLVQTMFVLYLFGDGSVEQGPVHRKESICAEVPSLGCKSSENVFKKCIFSHLSGLFWTFSKIFHFSENFKIIFSRKLQTNLYKIFREPSLISS